MSTECPSLTSLAQKQDVATTCNTSANGTILCATVGAPDRAVSYACDPGGRRLKRDGQSERERAPGTGGVGGWEAAVSEYLPHMLEPLRLG
jgi:hypothetical protein